MHKSNTHSNSSRVMCLIFVFYKTSRNGDDNAFYPPPTTWCPNAMTIDIVEIMESPHPMNCITLSVAAFVT